MGALSDLFSPPHFQVVPHEDYLLYVSGLLFFQLPILQLLSKLNTQLP